eukprot:6169800-Amphidinium_carterae.1
MRKNSIECSMYSASVSGQNLVIAPTAPFRECRPRKRVSADAADADEFWGTWGVKAKSDQGAPHLRGGGGASPTDGGARRLLTGNIINNFYSWHEKQRGTEKGQAKNKDHWDHVTVELHEETYGRSTQTPGRRLDLVNLQVSRLCRSVRYKGQRATDHDWTSSTHVCESNLRLPFGLGARMNTWLHCYREELAQLQYCSS